MNDHQQGGPPACLVCHDVNAAKHYGSVCCSGCKGFFRRTVRFNRKYVCVNNNTCPIKTEYRNCCRACRYSRCIKAGLNPLLVHSDRGASDRIKDAKKQAPKVKTEIPSTPPPDIKPCKQEEKTKDIVKRNAFDMDSEYEHWFALVTNGAMRLNEPNNLRLGAMKIIPEFDRNSVVSVANYFVLVERLCETFSDSDVHHLMSSEEEYSHSLDLPARLAFTKPRSISARTKLEWHGRFHTRSEFVKRMWCRIVAYYADWCNHLPELNELDERDKMILITERTVPVIDLILAFKAVQFGINGVPLSGGSYFPFDKDEQKLVDSSIQPYFHRLAKWMQIELVGPLREIGVTETEYVLLKNILFFSATSCLSAKGVETINRSRRFYRNILCKTIQNNFPDHTPDETLERVAAIMDLLPKVEQARAIEDEDFTVMTLFNIGEMKGSLSYDVHIRKGIDSLGL
uniref:Nuclear receptor domain-containing protein n=1 Tax=Panagrellus redivivus TaxID=6233 RepID=A0A7E4W5P2_PANRE